MATVTPLTLSFTPANWNVPRTVTVQPWHDGDSEPVATMIVLVIAGGGYQNMRDVVLPVAIEDDEAVVNAAAVRRVAGQRRRALQLDDLEHGNAAKGLADGVGSGFGDWAAR